MNGGIYEWPGGQKLHGDGRPVGEPPVEGSAIGSEEKRPFLRDVTTGWEKTKGDNEITCYSRMIGGVLCRWWGDGEAPSGVEMLNAAFPPNAPGEPQPTP